MNAAEAWCGAYMLNAAAAVLAYIACHNKTNEMHAITKQMHAITKQMHAVTRQVLLCSMTGPEGRCVSV